MFNRFVDWFSQGEGDSDFNVRDRNPFFIKLFIIFSAAFFVLLSTAYMSQGNGMFTYVVALTLVIGALGWFTTHFVVQHRDAVLTAEFQNMMFSAAAGLNLQYCLIIRPDGTIVYFDQGFRRHFPKAATQYSPTLDRVLAQSGVSDVIISQVYDVVSSNRSGRVVLPKDASGRQFILHIDALPRPKGYWAVRARDYVENRGGAEAPQMSANDMYMLTAALSQTPAALYVADTSGKLLLVSRTLEEWLGYSASELVLRGYGIADILHQQQGGQPGVLHLDAMENEFTFRHKNGSYLKAQARQQPFLNNMGDVIGATAVLDFAPPGVKKK